MQLSSRLFLGAASRSLLAVTALLIASPASALSLFQVGNSFTFDSLGFSADVLPIGTEEMLGAALGESIDLGYHVRGNQTLNSLWNNPTAAGTFTSSFGNHTVALPSNAWDYLAVQSFPSIDENEITLGEEVARVQDFIAAADSHPTGSPTVIIHAPWAGRGEGSWDEWNDPVLDDPTTIANYSVSYQNLLYDHVASANPGRVRLASAGKVIREIRDRILAGDAPIASTNDLYRDGIHMSDGLGKFAASTTMQTAILQRSQVGRPVTRNVPGWSTTRVSDEQARWIQLVAWEVLLNDSRSGVLTPAPGDFDGNGTVDADDLRVWQDDYGSTTRLLADANADGVVNAADYTVWRDSFAAIAAAASVPEPTTLVLVATGLLAVRRRRLAA